MDLGSTTSLTLQNPVIECGLNPVRGYTCSTWHHEFTHPIISDSPALTHHAALHRYTSFFFNMNQRIVVNHRTCADLATPRGFLRFSFV